MATRLRQAGHSLGQAIVRRVRLLGDKAPPNAHRPPARLVLSEISYIARVLAGRARQPLVCEQADHRRIVILFPGFGTNAVRMGYMARQLEQAGHKVKRWKMGYNFGPTPDGFDRLSARVEAVHRRYGQPVYLVGWSLGGIFARELAKLHPDIVAKVVTMGSPFGHTPYSNHVWRTYQLITGHSVADPPGQFDLRAKPPVETVALWSPRDAVVSARAACGAPGERDRAVALRCTHLGFSDSPEAIRAVLQELN